MSQKNPTTATRAISPIPQRNGATYGALGPRPEPAGRHVAIISAQGLLRHTLQTLVKPFGARVEAFRTFENLKSEIAHVEPGSILILEPVPDLPMAKQAEDVAKHSANWHLMLILKDIAEAEMGASIRAGVRGCITQETPPEVIGHLLEVVTAGHFAWPMTPNAIEGLKQRATDHASRPHPRRPIDIMQKLELLSKRELEVLENIGHGLGNKRVATAMGISDTTVRLHLRSIMRKLGAENRTQIAIWALHAQTEAN